VRFGHWQVSSQRVLADSGRVVVESFVAIADLLALAALTV